MLHRVDCGGGDTHTYGFDANSHDEKWDITQVTCDDAPNGEIPFQDLEDSLSRISDIETITLEGFATRWSFPVLMFEF